MTDRFLISCRAVELNRGLLISGTHVLTAACWIAFSVITAIAQAPALAPNFEAASVKPAEPQDAPPPFLPEAVAAKFGFAGGPGTSDPGRIRYHGVTLAMLLARAYKVPIGQISGPAWMGSERYTIEATLPPGTDADQFQLMLQELLNQRFLITLHREEKVIPVYRLKVAKNGPKLMPPETLPQYQDDDERKEATQKQALDTLAKMREDLQAGIRRPGRTSDMIRATTERFAEMLSGNVDRPVRDMTQIQGEYHFHLDWTPETAMHDDPSAISIFTAIEDQLGLKLEAGNEPIDMLVIDKAEKTPVSN